MNMSRKSVVALVVLVVVLFIVQLRMPKRWDWTPTYSPTDKNPFGSLLMDSVLRGSLPRGHYQVKQMTLWQWAHSRDSLSNVLWVTETATLDTTATLIIKRMMARGQRLMLVAKETRFTTGDNMVGAYQWGMAIRGSGRFSVADVMRLRQSHEEMDTISWMDSTGHVEHQYKVLRPMTDNLIQLEGGHEGNQWEHLIMSYGEDTSEGRYPFIQAARRRFGRGEIVVVAMPLLFTNYGMIEGETHEVVFRLLAGMADRPLVRLTDQNTDGADAQVENSPFRLILKDDALWWPFYTSLVLLVLFFVFTARRRQRAIPVVPPPVNHTLEFTRLIGTLFYQRHDRKGLLRCKWELFAQAVRRQADVDVQALDADDHLFQVLSDRTGMGYEEVARMIKRLRYLVANDSDMTADELWRAVDGMDDMARRLGAMYSLQEEEKTIN